MNAMNIDSLQIGEKVDLYLGSGPYYRTVVDDLPENRIVLLPIPTFKGIPISLKMDQKLQLFFYRDTGRYSVTVSVIGLDTVSQVKMVAFRMLSNPEQQQRRASFRVETMVKAIVRPEALGPFPKKPDPLEEKEMEEAPAFNISATGIAVRVKKEYHVGDQVYMKIFLAWPSSSTDPINVLCQIRQVSDFRPGSGMYQLGVMFLDADSALYEHIAKYVMIEDRRRLRQKKLVEEE